jgi:ADP-ribose pyrophosphatase YjhB (NUDIX family)
MFQYKLVAVVTLNTTAKFYSFIVKTIKPKEINGEFLEVKSKKNETPLQAVIREIKEKTGFDISNQAIETLKTVYVEYNEKNHYC